MKILYVEDNPANLYLVRRVARAGNHEVINYIDGEEALKDFDRISPDLVLLDIQLAGEMSGLEVVKDLRRRGYKTRVIAVTAYAMVGDKERCLAAGCDDYMAKPLPITRLVELFNETSTKITASSKEVLAIKTATAEMVAEKVEATTSDDVAEKVEAKATKEVMAIDVTATEDAAEKVEATTSDDVAEKVEAKATKEVLAVKTATTEIVAEKTEATTSDDAVEKAEAKATKEVLAIDVTATENVTEKIDVVTSPTEASDESVESDSTDEKKATKI